MRRTFVEPELLRGLAAGAELTLPKGAAHHLVRVLRLPEGASVEVFDGAGRIARGRLRVSPFPSLRLDEVGQARRDLPPLVVAQAAVRGAKLEEVVRRGTELSASAVWVYDAARSSVGAERLRQDRLLRIAREAARQCERADVPVLEGPWSFEALLEAVGGFAGVAVVGDLAAPRSLCEALTSDRRFGAGGLLVVVGPEGGLTQEELRGLEAVGVTGVRLGPQVLRTETAGLAGLAGALFALGVL